MAIDPEPPKVPNFPPMLSTVWVINATVPLGFEPVQVHGMAMCGMDGPYPIGPHWWTNDPKFVGNLYLMVGDGKTWLREMPKVTRIDQDFAVHDPDMMVMRSRVTAIEAMIRVVMQVTGASIDELEIIERVAEDGVHTTIRRIPSAGKDHKPHG